VLHWTRISPVSSVLVQISPARCGGELGFRAVSLVVTWLEHFTMRLGIGMATIASGLLSPSLFLLALVQLALDEIKNKMPPGGDH
jgi:hypothetical protein